MRTLTSDWGTRYLVADHVADLVMMYQRVCVELARPTTIRIPARSLEGDPLYVELPLARDLHVLRGDEIEGDDPPDPEDVLTVAVNEAGEALHDLYEIYEASAAAYRRISDRLRELDT